MCHSGKKFGLRFVILVIVFLFAGGVQQVQSQDKYPSRAIQIIVPYSPGGGTDLCARVLAAYAKKKLNVAINVVNKPGGNGVPACLELYNSPPDGYSLLLESLTTSSMLPIVIKNLSFNVWDRAFIATAAIAPMVLIVSPSSPFKSMRDLEVEAKKNPENFTWTSLGGTGQPDFTIRQFLKAIGVDVSKTKPIMSQGGSQAATHIAGGFVKMGVVSTATGLPAIKGGMIVPIAVSANTRLPQLPDVPTTAEQGYPMVNLQDRYGLSGPPRLPSHIIDMWNGAMQEMPRDPEGISKMSNVGLISSYLNSREAREYFEKRGEEAKELWEMK